MPLGTLALGAVGGLIGGGDSVQPVSPELVNLVNSIPGFSTALGESFTQGTEAQVQNTQQGLGALNAFGGEALGLLGAQSGLANDALINGANTAFSFQQPLLGFTNEGAGLLRNIADRVGNGEFQVDPFQFNNNFQFDFSAGQEGFDFQNRRGNDAINAGANARGLLNSGGRLRELAEFNQGLANTFRGQEFDRQQGAFNNAFNRDLSGFNANRAAINDNLNALNSLQGIGSNFLGVGVGASNNSSDIFNQLGINQANNFNQFGQAGAGVLTGLGAGNLEGLSNIGAVRNAGITGAAGSLNNGLLTQIDALGQIEAI